jgi:hypothetical protein
MVRNARGLGQSGKVFLRSNRFDVWDRLENYSMHPLLRVLSWAIALCGLWEFSDIILPFVIGVARVQPVVWGHIVAGIILIIAGVWAALTSDSETAKTMDWSATIAGAWLVIAPFGFGASRLGPAVMNDVLVGAVVLILASASGLLHQRSH